MSKISEFYAALQLDSSVPLQVISQSALLEPAELGMTPGYLLNPMSAVLVTDIDDETLVRTALDQVYPKQHPLRMTSEGLLADPLHPLQHGSYLTAMEYVTARLRAPNGCPWDREQNHQTIKNNLLEESYETLEALDLGDNAKLAEELGDLLMQVVLHAEIARQQGEFDLRDVVSGITSKLVRRHPHVFGDVTANSAGEVLQNWDEIKKKERGEDVSILASVAPAMPALAYAQEVSKRAARQGFEWPDSEGVLAKVREEIHEFIEAPDHKAVVDEFGDLLFSLVQVARFRGFEAEEALRLANRKFRNRFESLERLVRSRGLSLKGMSIHDVQALWEEVKAELGND